VGVGASAGDVNGDGYGDVVLGAQDWKTGLQSVFVYLGGAGGLATSPAATPNEPNSASDGFGRSFASAGDVNGDGFADLVLRRENMLNALKRVKSNAGAAGIDGMTVEELDAHLREHWLRIREELRRGRYHPQPVRKVEIPKPGGKGTRTLGIPTVLDRLLQQALLQVLQPIFDPTFSDASFGFRPGRGTHQAVERAREHIASGRMWVVDLDLEKFFDRVNHDVLMARVARRVKDKKVLLLIRRFLQAGMMEGGLVSPRIEGTPRRPAFPAPK
jgi:retron-type reverse transcriptase